MENNDPTQPSQTEQPARPQQPVVGSSKQPLWSKSKKWTALLAILLIMVLGGAWLLVNQSSKPASKPSSSSANPETASGKYQAVITIDANGYTPTTLNVKPDTRVVWDNKDSTSHTVMYTSSTGGEIRNFGGGTNRAVIAVGAAYNYLFANKGSYYLHDNDDPRLNMVIVVQ